MNKMKKIGQGAFSKVYRKSSDTVLIKSIDHVKECMSLGWFPNSRMFPKIEQVGQDDYGEYKFYESKYYPRISSLKNELLPSEWEFYKALRGLDRFSCIAQKGSYLDHWRKQFETLPSKFNHKKQALFDALDALSNYGNDICFEISPRNIAVSGKKLVLLDCFFFHSQLMKATKKRNRWN